MSAPEETPTDGSSTVDGKNLKEDAQVTEAPAAAEVDNIVTKEFGFLPIPRNLRHIPHEPHHFGWTLNLAFGFWTMFTAANLYYCQPILIQLSNSFHVDYKAVSRIPTLVQAGYAVGLLLITPLGDLARRRQLILLLEAISTALTIGLAVTSSLVVFETLSFLVGVFTVVPQILLPLSADLAPPHRRATVISIVLSGLLLGILGARVLTGIIAEFSSWRVVYYFALGVQGVVLASSWFMLPDYPSKNVGMQYWEILWSMAKITVTEPVLIQGCLINVANSACFSSFWVTLTFLLGGEPFNYSTLIIGLFGLVGIAGVALGPVLGYAVDRLDTWYSALVSVIIGTIFLAVQAGAGGISVAAVIIAAFGYDLSRQSVAVALSARIFALDPAARSRMNAALILAFFIGQVMGSSVGTLVFVKYGWRAAAGLSVAWMGFQVGVLFLRGPHCERRTWFGYEGGFGWRRQDLPTKAKAVKERTSEVTVVDDDPEKRNASSREKGDYTWVAPPISLVTSGKGRKWVALCRRSETAATAAYVRQQVNLEGTVKDVETAGDVALAT